ncbi:MAG: bifunctional diaminohydroxyphosphoribosylaminopyrimidine deaminase/5-amino-6-(5-phosphoribosylamino)uracil reductase RibD, partial [Prevotella sp.]|nr:bifunctional diaminohydroxyphosphoribosylaminopyrimidine deaminase/5-amino-6-(5-phosphoribosylamino)uracil reductase RibD [Prevotella sp.]
MKKFFVLLVLVITAIPSFAQIRGNNIVVIVSPDHQDWNYKVGEKATFSVQVLKSSTLVDNVQVDYEAGPDMYPDVKKSTTLKDGTMKYTATMNKPGFYRFKVKAHVGGKDYVGVSTAAFSPEKLQPYAQCPKDFDEFWNKALADARNKGNDTSGSTAYVTLEPCSHFGLTPPCAVALVKAGVKRVVCAMTDPNPLVSGKGFDILRDAGIEVIVGICEHQARRINVPFLYAMEHEIPYVTQKMGISLDGRIALKNGASKWITSAESRADVQTLRAQHQAILTTAATVIADDPSMNVRTDEFPKTVKLSVPEEYVVRPLKVIVDKRKVLTLKEKIFSSSGDVLLVYPSDNRDVSEKKLTEKINVL